MSYHVDLEKRVIDIDGDGSDLTRGESKIINSLTRQGYSIVRTDTKKPVLMLPEKSSAKTANFQFKDDMYHKYEVVFSMRSNPDAQFSGKMLARIICDTPDKLKEYLSSSYVRVYNVWPVGKKRGEYLKDKRAEFHTLSV